jgi:hypothetical protein
VPRAEAARAGFGAREPLTVGPLRQDGALVATVPTRRPPWRSFGGVRVDALLAGGFLRRYA